MDLYQTSAVIEVSPAAEVLALTRTKARVASPSSAFCDVPVTEVWVALPPGVSEPPPVGPVTTNPNPQPINAAPIPEDFDDTDLCYIFQDLLPEDLDAVLAEELEPVGFLEPYNLTISLEGRTTVGLTIREYPYALTLPGDTAVFVTRSQMTIVSYILSANAGSLAISGQAVGTLFYRRLQGAAGAFVTTGLSSGFVRDYVVGTNAGTFTLSGQPGALLYSRLPLAADAGAFAFSGQSVEWFLGKTLIAENASFSINGQDAGSVRNYVIVGDAGAITSTGQAANLNYVQPLFKALTYTGNGTTTNAVTGAGFKPGFVWCKRLSGTAENHRIHTTATQSISGGNYFHFATNSTSVGSAATEFITFDSDGFTLKSSTIGNANSASYLAYCWKEGNALATNNDGSIQSTVSVNSTLGISFIRATGTGATGTVGHGLGVEPEVVIMKSSAAAGPYFVGSLVTTSQILNMTTTAARASGSAIWTSGNTTTITIGSSTNINLSGTQIHIIAFASKTGFSKHSTFSGNGSATQSITGLGFSPSWVMVKSLTGGTSDWVIFVKGRDGRVIGNSSGDEQATDFITFDSDGFTLESGASVNSSGVTYVYMSFA